MAGRQIPLPVPPNIIRELAFEFVHQDLGLVPSLSVMENLCIADLATSKYGWHIPWRKIRRATREIFARYGIRFDPDTRVAELNPIQRALLAIVRAVEGMRHTLGEGSDHRGLLGGV
jgi:ribose transport system ATP-binding protein